jgi:rhamnose utilization protein RhaD (predicted bifunctional aldolase and dehydrogenase)
MALQKSPDPRPSDFDALQEMSAAFGQNPLHIQGAGGNVSVKDGDTMWIKASGTRLSDALASDVFVPVDLLQMKTAITQCAPTADTPAVFLIPGASDLRPSIETSLHAIFPHRIVLHTHCIHTLAHAVQENAVDLLTDRLADFDWAYVPYTKPGANLARSVSNVLNSKTNVVVLGNHGLIVAAETVDAVRELQSRVHAALTLVPVLCDGANPAQLTAICDGTHYAPANDPFVHQLALTPERVEQVTTGSLYPDHVIFCGIALMALQPDETLSAAERRVLNLGLPPPICLLVPGAGLILREDASQGTHFMVCCLADVITRVPDGAVLTYLSNVQNLELLDWDAEKYRRALNAK